MNASDKPGGWYSENRIEYAAKTLSAAAILASSADMEAEKLAVLALARKRLDRVWVFSAKAIVRYTSCYEQAVVAAQSFLHGVWSIAQEDLHQLDWVIDPANGKEHASIIRCDLMFTPRCFPESFCIQLGLDELSLKNPDAHA